MASAPFLPNEALPEDDDVVANFPAAERTFRDVVESWLNAISNTYGYVEIPSISTAARDAITQWTEGNMVFNETLNCFQVCKSADPDVWSTIGFSAGDRLVCAQTTAPLGWTVESGAAYNGATFRNVTSGTVSTGGSTAFTSVFTARTIAEANLPAVTKSVTGSVTGTFSGTGTAASDGAHSHTSNAGTVNGTNVAEQNPNDVTLATANSSATIDSGGAHTHSVTVSGNISASFSSGVTAALGSGTAMDFAVKYVDTKIIQKDTY